MKRRNLFETIFGAVVSIFIPKSDAINLHTEGWQDKSGCWHSPAKKLNVSPLHPSAGKIDDGIYFFEVEPFEIDLPDINTEKLHRFTVRRILLRIIEHNKERDFIKNHGFYHTIPWSVPSIDGQPISSNGSHGPKERYAVWCALDTSQENHLMDKCRPPCILTKKDIGEDTIQWAAKKIGGMA